MTNATQVVVCAGQAGAANQRMIHVSYEGLVDAIVYEVQDAFPHPHGFKSEVSDYQARLIAKRAVDRALRQLESAENQQNGE